MASLICMMVLMLSISLVFNEWLKLISNDTERIIGLFVWLFAICVGGYFAARQGRTTGWSNSLAVGVLAELFVAARLSDGTSFLEMMDDPGPNWRRLVALGLTIPAAIVGGIVWEKTCRLDQAGDSEQSESFSEAEPEEE